MRDVYRRWGEFLPFGVAVVEEGIGLTLDFGVEIRLRRHGVERKTERIAEVHAGDQSCCKLEA